MNPIELKVNRINTKAFIDADPIEVVLNRRLRVDTPDGGFKWGENTAQTSQVFRLLPQEDIVTVVQTPDGVQVIPQYVLLGEWDCNLERWDHFNFDGVEYIVTSPIRPLHTNNSRYETKADVGRV